MHLNNNKLCCSLFPFILANQLNFSAINLEDILNIFFRNTANIPWVGQDPAIDAGGRVWIETDAKDVAEFSEHLDELVVKYSSEDIKDIKEFGQDLLEKEHSLFVYSRIFSEISEEQRKESALFYLLNYLTDETIKRIKHIPDEDIFEDEHEMLYLDLFNKVMKIYKDKLSDFKNPVHENFHAFYLIFYKNATKLLDNLPAENKQEASIRLFDILRTHFNASEELNGNNVDAYVDAFLKINQCVKDSRLIADRNFNTEFVSLLLDYQRNLEPTVVTKDVDYYGALIASLKNMDFPEEQTLTAYHLLKRKLLSNTYSGRDIESSANFLQGDFVYFGKILSKVFEKFNILMDKSNLSPKNEYSDLNNLFSTYISISLDNMKQNHPLASYASILKLDFDFLDCMTDSDSKEILGILLADKFDSFMRACFLRNEFVNYSEFSPLLKSVKKSMGDYHIDHLIPQIKRKCFNQITGDGLGNYENFLSSLDTENSLDEFVSVLLGEYHLEGNKCFGLSRILSVDLQEYLSRFDFELLLEKSKETEISDKKIKFLNNAMQEIALEKFDSAESEELSNYVTFCISARDFTFLRQSIKEKWNYLPSSILDKTITLIKEEYCGQNSQILSSNRFMLYLDSASHLPSQKEVELERELYENNEFIADAITDLTRKNGVFETDFNGACFFVSKTIIDRLALNKSSEAKEFISEMSNNFRESQDVRNYAFKKLRNWN